MVTLVVAVLALVLVGCSGAVAPTTMLSSASPDTSRPLEVKRFNAGEIKDLLVGRGWVQVFDSDQGTRYWRFRDDHTVWANVTCRCDRSIWLTHLGSWAVEERRDTTVLCLRWGKSDWTDSCGPITQDQDGSLRYGRRPFTLVK